MPLCILAMSWIAELPGGFSHHCIFPASGFFEWTGDKGVKTPYLFTAGDSELVLAFAGPLGKVARSCEGRRCAVIQHHRVGRIAVDAVLSRSHAGVDARGQS